MARGNQTDEVDHGLQLPRLLREVAEVIGLPATTQLVARYGGTSITIPSTTQRKNQLAQMLGPEATAKLVRIYAGCRLYIPKTDCALRAARNIEIYQRYKHGLADVNQIAREHHLSDRTVWKIIERQKKAARAALKLALNAS